MATAVDQAIAEITERLAAMAAPHEGLRDFNRLNLLEDTHREIAAAITRYDRRKQALEVAKAALEVLVNDGHPELPVQEISPEAVADLQANLDTIAAARARFASNVATAITLNPGAVEAKGDPVI
jgi:hypothetical protein